MLAKHKEVQYNDRSLTEVIMKIHSSWTVDFLSELYEAGWTEDGEKYIAETYFVMIWTPDGVFKHGARFDGTVQKIDPEFGEVYYPDLRDKAKADAQALADKIIAKGEIDAHYWDFRPHYSKGGADLLWEEEMAGIC